MPDFESVTDGREIPLKGSLLALFMKWGMNDSFPAMTEELAIPTNNISIPLLDRTIRVAEILDAENKKENDRPIPPAHITIKNESDYQIWRESEKKKAVMNRLKQKPKPNLLKNPKAFIKNKILKKLLGPMMDFKTPSAIRERYEGLSDIEATIAFGQFSLGAKVAGNNFHPELDNWLANTCQKAGIKKPRLIIMDSDTPFALALTPPDEEPAVMVTANAIEILNERQLKAILCHELSHIKDRGHRGVFSMLSKYLEGRFSSNESIIREELRADKRAVSMIGSADDLVDGIMILQERFNQLKRFAKQLSKIMDDHKIQPNALPGNLRNLFRFLYMNPRIFNERSKNMRRLNNMIDPHPPFEERCRVAFATEDAIRRGSRPSF